jgi:L-ascorbate metabolism protein UlaG (beta-lactamase superfamily)
MAADETELEVTSIANEGFLIRSPAGVILVDALFRATADYPEFFQQGPSRELLSSLLAAEEPFAQVDLALVTHPHGDHHHAPTALEFLRRHPETLLIGTAAVAASISALPGSEGVSDRILAPSPKMGSCVELDPRGISVRVCAVAHSGMPELVNHVYRVELGQCSFLHEGDADLNAISFAGMAGRVPPPDLAFLHSWWVTSFEGRQAVLEHLHPGSVVLMHHRWAAAAEARDRVSALRSEDKQALPPILVFGDELETATVECSPAASDSMPAPPPPR